MRVQLSTLMSSLLLKNLPDQCHCYCQRRSAIHFVDCKATEEEAVLFNLSCQNMTCISSELSHKSRSKGSEQTVLVLQEGSQPDALDCTRHLRAKCFVTGLTGDRVRSMALRAYTGLRPGCAQLPFTRHAFSNSPAFRSEARRLSMQTSAQACCSGPLL